METTALLEIVTAFFFAGALVMWGVVFYYYRQSRRRYLSEWLITWTLLLFSYGAFYLALATENSVFGYLFSLGIIAAGYFFQKGVYAYGEKSFLRIWSGVLFAFFVLVFIHPLFDYPLSIFASMVFTFSAFFFGVSGVELLRGFEGGMRAVGVFHLLYAVYLAFFPLIVSSPLYIPYGLSLTATLGLGVSVSMLYMHFVRENHKEQLEKQRLQYLSFHDRLTGLKNRAYLEEYIQPAYEDYEQACTVMFIDLNNLKEINDTYGHRVGDQLLARTAEILNSLLEEGDLLVRYGGDEFVLVRPHAQKEANDAFLEQLSRYSSEIGEDPAPFSFAVGVAIREKGEPLPALIEMAERGMYQQKDDRSRIGSQNYAV